MEALTDAFCERTFVKLKAGKQRDINKQIKEVIREGGASNIYEGLDLLANQEQQGTVMNWLVRMEKYEDAGWLKQVCDRILATLSEENNQKALQARTINNLNNDSSGSN